MTSWFIAKRIKLQPKKKAEATFIKAETKNTETNTTNKQRIETDF